MHSEPQVNPCMSVGRTAETLLNKQSSRSHSAFCITLHNPQQGYFSLNAICSSTTTTAHAKHACMQGSLVCVGQRRRC